MKPYLSIVIPTYNRAEKLDRALAHLYDQEIAHESYEVIVVDDGSMDETDKVLKSWKGKWPQLSTLHQSNSGQAKARNRGIKKAQGQVLLIGQDDIYAAPNFLKSHINFHQQFPEMSMACLGLTEWWPELEVSDFMHWLTQGGPQFAYEQLSPNESVEHWFFYTSNISLKTEVLQKNLFDEEFSAYGWEDIELGHRLMSKGLELLYRPEALAWHDHMMHENDFRERMLSIGRGAPLLEEKSDAIGAIPRGAKLMILLLIGNAFTTTLLSVLSHLGLPFKRLHWYALSKRYFLEGLRSV